ncbi:MAG: DUF2793 domain-containing protein [Hyphomicrobiaceae bacterium]|nr:MAG: DUF2793 domain-containing protein [Hyphomicrobiaceae bacterium]
MDGTPNLTLPYIIAAQAQKHVTHNEALRALDAIVQLMVMDKDLSAPPASPADGARYIVAAGATGAWSGHSGRVAAYQDGAWMFYVPREGWLAWAADEDELYAYTGSAWALFASGGGGGIGNVVEDATPQLGGDLDANGNSIGFDDATGITDDSGNEQLVFHKTASAANQIGVTNAAAGNSPQIGAEGDDADISLRLRGKGTGFVDADKLGINATADTTNRLAVRSAASLFDNTGNGHQQKINKAAAGDTASQLYQTGYSGRAEFGLIGDDDFHVKVSADGTTWNEALIVDKATGAARFPSTFYVDLPAGSAPATPASGKVRLYAKADKSFYQKDDAGAETALAGGGSGGGTANPNLLANPDGRIDQRHGGSAATTADDAYGGPDRWYSLTQTAAITVQRQTNGEDGMPFYQRLTQAQATAQRMGRATILESADSRQVRGAQLTLSGRIRCSSGQAIRYAILEWTGTADAVTSDVVANWASSTYTAGNFFLGSNLTVAAVGTITPAANTWTDLTALTGTCGSSANNLIVMIWTEGTAAQNVTLDFRLKLEQGASATAYQQRHLAVEAALCERFYQKSYDADTAPGTAFTAGGDGPEFQHASGTMGVTLMLAARMRAAPTVTVYDAAGNADKVSYYNGSWQNNGALSVLAARQTLVYYQHAISGALFTNFHYAADAEL